MDELYTMWERYERAIIAGGLSKAYGLPGLRIGWIVAPRSSNARGGSSASAPYCRRSA